MSWTLKATADFDLDGNDETLEYELKLVQNLDSNGNIPFVGIETNQPENNAQFGFQGKTLEIPVSLVVYDDGTDKSNGTFSSVGLTDARISGSEINTVREQIIFLRQYIHNSQFGTTWTLEGGRFSDYDGDGTVEGTPVALTNVKIRETADNPLRATADLKMKVGNVVG